MSPTPEEARWNRGCWIWWFGMSDIREADADRLCWTVFGACGSCVWCETELERFMADEGIGIAEMLLLRTPSVCCLSVLNRVGSG